MNIDGVFIFDESDIRFLQLVEHSKESDVCEEFDRISVDIQTDKAYIFPSK